MKTLAFFVGILCAFTSYSRAQTIELQGKVIDKLTKEPIAGASIKVNNLNIGKSDASGSYKVSVLRTDTLYVSCAGFQTCCYQPSIDDNVIALEQEIQTLKEIVVTAGRVAESRRESPVAISTIGTLILKEAKANSIDQVLNKASGVFMVNLGNEQHQMSIRQPMTTKSLFLYLEDGIPVRTTGLYNHNALIEMNMAAMKQIEVIRGPASAMYGAEAIGGAVNVITLSAPAQATGQISIQANTNGYKRTDIQYGDSFGRAGVLVSGYYADKTGGRLQHSDFSKAALSVKSNYNFNASTRMVNSISYNNYYSDMFGALDSSHYAGRNFSSLNNFTFRKVKALRIKSQLDHRWNDFAETKASLVYRDNSIDQNPAYKIKNDYRRVAGTYQGNPFKAHGEISTSQFNTFALFLQHDQKLEKLGSKISAGANLDFSPSKYQADYISIDKDEAGFFTGYSKSDSALSSYSTAITNLASYLSYNQEIWRGLKLVAAIRYDYYHYNYQNKLSGSAFSGAPNTKNNFQSFTPKLGLTYNYQNVGFYTNFSQGFVPPQISELYQGVKVPYLSPQKFYNYELGGWLELYKGKIFADWSLYSMKGTDEIISVLADDGTSKNENAGKTSHLGFEYGVNYRPFAELKLRISAANSRHTFIQFVEKGLNYNGNVMAGAPGFLANGEISYRPAFLKGLRTSVEWQHQSSYWLDNINSKKYGGFNVYNVRGAYQFKQFEVWLNILNAADTYYSVAASKSASGYSYNLGQPRTFNTGISYQLSKR